MATRIVGIDLGAYSVKVAVANPGFHRAGVVDFIEKVVPPGEEPYAERAGAVLRQIVAEQKLAEESFYASVAGNNVFIHVLEFAFKNLRRSDLSKAVGGELEGILPIEYEEMVFAFETLPDKVDIDEDALGEPLVTEDEPTFVQNAPGSQVVHGRVASPTTGTRVLACAMSKMHARQLIAKLDGSGVEARGLIAAPAAYAHVAQRIKDHSPEGKGKGKGKLKAKKQPPVAIIDVGHDSTDVCVVKDGRPVFARSIARGGRHVTEAIARRWQISYEQAQEYKHSDAFIASKMVPMPHVENAGIIQEEVESEMGPLARDLRQTLHACRAKTGATVTACVLVGGGSRLRGLQSYFTEKLRIPVETLTEMDTANILGARLASVGAPADAACLAAGVAFDGATGRPMFDMRQGELAYKADLSFLRQKAFQLAVAVVVVLAFATGNAYAALYKLRKAEDTLERRLQIETTEVWGTALDVEETMTRTEKRSKSKGGSPLPKLTAYDILLEINKRFPPKKDVKIDIREVRIKPGTITIKGQSAPQGDKNAMAGINALEEGLKKQKCFEKITRNKVTSGAKGETKTFELQINSKCM